MRQKLCYFAKKLLVQMLKYLFTIFLFSSFSFAQECDYSSNVKDSIGIYKSTKDYLVNEKIFGNKTSLMYFSLINTDGTPSLNVQMLQKTNDFTKINCFNKNSRLYFQLENGKIVTLIHIDQNTCGTIVRDEKGNNNRILIGYFDFIEGSLADLKGSPISILRIKYDINSQDFIFKKRFISEFDKVKYEPSNYFINFLRCVE